MKERVQLNLSVTLEQKLALQALAEGHGTSVTKLVLGLIDQGLSPSPSPTAAAAREAISGALPAVIKSPAEVPAAVRRVATKEEARAFRPYSKERQVGKAQKKKAEPAATCRHGLLRCKVCGTG